MDTQAHLRDVLLQDETLRKALCLQAEGLFRVAGKAGCMVDGITCEDLASEALIEVLESGYKNWDETKGTLKAYLAGIVKNKWRDHLRRVHRHPCSSLSEEKIADEVAGQREFQREPEREIYERQVIDIANRVDSKFFGGMKNIDEGHDCNKQLANELGTTPNKVSKRREKIIKQVRASIRREQDLQTTRKDKKTSSAKDLDPKNNIKNTDGQTVNGASELSEVNSHEPVSG